MAIRRRTIKLSVRLSATEYECFAIYAAKQERSIAELLRAAAKGEIRKRKGSTEELARLLDRDIEEIAEALKVKRKKK